MADETSSLSSVPASLENQFESVLADYLRRTDRGEAVDRDALMAEYPALAQELREFFANEQLFHKAVDPAGSVALSAATHLRYFGDYELLGEIAHGGMGIVYRARQVSLNRAVAVKMILAGQLANEAEVLRFHGEAEAAANLRHPGVVAIYEVGVNAGQHYYSMELVDGRDLSALLRERPIGIVEAAQYVREIAEIVEFAHSQGVLHRDLKPSNILIDSRGRVRVTDFGLAKRVQSESDLTLTGQVLGTPTYMSPEQAAAQHVLIGPTSDVYSLGVMLYEMLTGRPPFRSANAHETLRQVQQEEPVRVRALNPNLPRDLETICLKCLEKEPRKRYSSAQQLSDDLGRFLRSEPIFARPIGRLERTLRWCLRHPTTAALSASLVLSLIIGSMASSYFGWRASEKAQKVIEAVGDLEQVQERLDRANDQLATGEAKLSQLTKDVTNLTDQARTARGQAKDATQKYSEVRGQLNGVTDQLADVNSQLHARLRNLALTSTRLAGVLLKSHRVIEAQLELDRCPLEMRTWEWDFYQRGCRPLLQEFNGATCGAFTSDGRWLAIGSDERRIEIQEFDTGKKLHGVNVDGAPSSLLFSDDGQWLAIFFMGGEPKKATYPRDLQLWHIPTGRLVPMGTAVDIAFGNNSTVLWVLQEGNCSQWDLTTHEDPILARTVPMVGVGGISKEGAILVRNAPPTGVEAIDRNTNSSRYLAKVGGISFSFPDFQHFCVSDDGTKIAASCKDFIGVGGAVETKVWICVWNATDGTLLHDSQHRDMIIDQLSFTPSGTQLICATARPLPAPRSRPRSDRCDVRVFDLETSDWVRVLPWHGAKITSAKCSSDGRWLASSDGQSLKIWDICSAKEPALLGRQIGQTYAVALSPDGRIAASGTGESPSPNIAQVVLWDVATGAEICQLPQIGRCVRLEFSPDGRLLAGAGSKVVVWDVASRQPALVLDKGADCVTFSSDGRQIATFQDEQTQIWDLQTKSLLVSFEGGGWGIALSPDSSLLAVSGKSNCVWDLATQKKLWSISEIAYRVAFSPDGKSVAIGHGMRGGQVTLVEAETGTVIRKWLTGWNAEYVLDLAFTRDGSLLATAGFGEVAFWDSETGQLAFTLTHPEMQGGNTWARAYAIGFSGDGRRMIGGWCKGRKPGDGSVAIWDMTIGPKSLNYQWLKRPVGLVPEPIALAPHTE